MPRPADLAFGREPLAEVLGDGAGFAEGLGDALGVGLRDPWPIRRRWRPNRCARCRTGRIVQVAQLRGRCGRPFRTCVEERARVGCAAHRRAAAGGRPDGRHQRADAQTLATRASRPAAPDRRRTNRCRCAAANRNRSTPSNRTPSTSAAAVRSSMVSRSMGGSESGPLPTSPGHMALWSAG